MEVHQAYFIHFCFLHLGQGDIMPPGLASTLKLSKPIRRSQSNISGHRKIIFNFSGIKNTPCVLFILPFNAVDSML
jgi:hypothetical protein